MSKTIKIRDISVKGKQFVEIDKHRLPKLPYSIAKTLPSMWKTDGTHLESLPLLHYACSWYAQGEYFHRRCP